MKTPAALHRAAIAASSAALLAHAAATAAYDLQSVEATREGARYRVQLRVRLAAPARDAYAVFADVARLPELNPAILAARVLDTRGPLQQTVQTRIRICIGPLCKVLQQVQDMRFAPDDHGGSVDAVVQPQHSDFRYGRAHWELRDCDGATCLAFDAELEPAFWVPPLIGPWLVRRKLRDEALVTSAGIERRAAALH